MANWYKGLEIRKDMKNRLMSLAGKILPGKRAAQKVPAISLKIYRKPDIQDTGA